MSIVQLVPGVQSYDWGIPGGRNDCLVANFAEKTPALSLARENDKPYAELWMGTHPTLPSRAILEDQSTPLLNDVLVQDRSKIGQDVERVFPVDQTRGALPFLFKVLSINKALSIQAHPDKKLAEKLNAEKPKMYKDDNHKPEMAIALQPFEGFCGFRPLKEIAEFVRAIPELRKVLGADESMCARLQEAAELQSQSDNAQAQETVRATLKDVFSALMHAEQSTYAPAVADLAERLRTSEDAAVPAELSELVQRLNQQYPQDVGVFCTFFLNVVHLQKGEAMFLKANEPHAYLSGNILECMAASDNVVRAGLTPKARDVDVLVNMLTYESASAEKQRLDSPVWEGDATKSTLLYDPPIPEFAMLVTNVASGAKAEHRALNGPSIVLITQGAGTLNENVPISEGRVYFVAAHTALTVEATEPLIMARAFVEPSP